MKSPMEQFAHDGFAIFPADTMGPLDELRRQIFDKARTIFGENGTDPAAFFNGFHRLSITGTQLNDLRMKLIRECTDSIDSGTLIFEAFQSTILGLLGPDLFVQKNTNLVIQQPQDPNPSELHRDAPLNSPYELVVWLPLVDCYRTKSMYMLNREGTSEALKILANNPNDWPRFESHCLEVAPNVDVPYGTALMFWTGCFHGSRMNVENETRWSLNMRYKSLFAPNGLKDAFEFFKVFRMSPLTRMGLDFEKTGY